MRRSDPNTIENGHIYSSVKQEEVFMYWVLLVRRRILWAGLMVISSWIISQRNIGSVWDINASMR